MTAPEPDTDRIARLLRAEAARHEPDSARLRTLVRAVAEPATPAAPGTAGPTRPDTLRLAPPVAPGPSRSAFPAPTRSGALRRLAWPLAAAAMATALVLGVARARTGSAPRPQPPLSYGAAPVTGAGPSAVTSSGLVGSRPASSPSSPVTTSTPSPASTTSARGWLRPAVSFGVRPVSDRFPVQLPAAGDRDWIVVGGRSDGVLVRAKHPTTPLGTVVTTGFGAAVFQGPFALSWSGGVPEQDRAVDSTWQSIPVSTGRIRITLPVPTGRFQLVLSLGTVRTTGRVTVGLGGQPAAGTAGVLVPPCGTDVCADQVTVDVDPSGWPAAAGSQLVIDLTGADPQQGLGVGLAAVELR